MEKLVKIINSEYNRNIDKQDIIGFLKVLGYKGKIMSQAQLDAIRQTLFDYDRVFGKG